MSRFLADSLDLSRLPSPQLVPLDFEAIMVERRATLVAEMAAAGVDYDVDMLELDSAIILQETDATREMLARQAINDAGLANMLAHSRGNNLDQLGANVGVVRARTGTDPTTALPIMETDAAFRRRVQLAPEAFATAGSEGGYIFHALNAQQFAGLDKTIIDASVTNPARGEVVVTVMVDRADPTPTDAEVEVVRAHLFREDIKPITDILTVQGAETIEVDIEANLTLYGGPDATTVASDARANLVAFLVQNKRLGRDLNLGAWAGRLYRDTVHSVAPIEPNADVLASPAQVVWVRSITLNHSGRDE